MDQVVEIPSVGPATASVILLHGLGADGHDLAPLAQVWSASGRRFVCPHAPERPISVNAGMPLRAWFDGRSADGRAKDDELSVRDSARRIEALVEAERAAGIPAERIALVGFSQGAAMALHVGLRYDEPLAGVAAMSGFLVLADALDDEAHEAQAETPFFVAHGDRDPLVHPDRGREVFDALLRLGRRARWASYPVAHEIADEEVDDVGAWLDEVLGAREGDGAP